MTAPPIAIATAASFAAALFRRAVLRSPRLPGMYSAGYIVWEFDDLAHASPFPKRPSKAVASSDKPVARMLARKSISQRRPGIPEIETDVTGTRRGERSRWVALATSQLFH